MEGAAPSPIEVSMPWIVLVNFGIVALLLIVGGRLLLAGGLTDELPGRRQNIAEAVVGWFFAKAREMGSMRIVRIVAPFLATCFLLILISNMLGMIPLPLLNNPPTAYFSVTLGLAICAVGGTLVISFRLNGGAAAVKHLFWPNPLQFISEFTDVLSLSLRLFGNIGGEHMTLVLVTSAVAVGIPLILHVLGLIPAFVQALVFTLLTTSFIAGVVHEHAEEEEATDMLEEGVPEAERRMPTPAVDA